ncbi:hypothetical protein ZWY2020_020240 [Hordeum vulgare]|nr:hypothetical protein ZWY2020_020240 [Hordeum vulgare]
MDRDKDSQPPPLLLCGVDADGSSQLATPERWIGDGQRAAAVFFIARLTNRRRRTPPELTARPPTSFPPSQAKNSSLPSKDLFSFPGFGPVLSGKSWAGGGWISGRRIWCWFLLHFEPESSCLGTGDRRAAFRAPRSRGGWEELALERSGGL